MKSPSLLSSSSRPWSWHLIALLSVLILDRPIHTTSLENQHEVTNDDYGNYSIDPHLRLKIMGKSSADPLTNDGTNAIVTVLSDFATERVNRFFNAQYPPNEEGVSEFAFQSVEFNAISTDDFTVEAPEVVVEGEGEGEGEANSDGGSDGTGTRMRSRRTLRVFEREEAEMEQDMIMNMGMANDNDLQVGTHLARGQRALEGDRYGTSLVFNGTLSFEYLSAPPAVCQQALQKVMDSKWGLYMALRDASVPELGDLSGTSDLIWEVLTPEPTISPAPSSPKPPTASPTYSSFDIDLGLNVIITSGTEDIETVEDAIRNKMATILDETSDVLGYDVTFTDHDVTSKDACVNVESDLIEEGQRCHFLQLSATGRPNEDVSTSYENLIASYEDRLGEVAYSGGMDHLHYFIVTAEATLVEEEPKKKNIAAPIGISLSAVFVAALAVGLTRKRFKNANSPQKEQYIKNKDVEVLFPIPTVPKEEEEVMILEMGRDSWEVTRSMDDH